ATGPAPIDPPSPWRLTHWKPLTPIMWAGERLNSEKIGIVWHELIANLAVVTLFISVWANAQHFVEMRSRIRRDVIFAVLMGAGALATMSLTVELSKGILFDLRTTFVAIASLYAGPIGGL